MSDRSDYSYPDQVCYEIPEKDFATYRQAAQYINRYGYDVLSIQHEYGIFGGDSGSYLLSLAKEVRMPIVTTLHTVLKDPSPDQKSVMDELLQISERIVVMSKKALEFLVDVHNVDLNRVDVIPHGIPKFSNSKGTQFREKLNIKGPMILTFGLLSPTKGIEVAIAAMPKIVEKHPGATYVIVGATHPNLRASVGEAYRESLVELAEELGVRDNVRFVDRFVTLDELVDYLEAMDMYITPYLNPKQITSGTLAYSLGTGKPVISTPYWYAQELLSEGRGILVPFHDSKAISDAVLKLQDEPEVRREMGRRACEYSQKMKWSEVAKSYIKTFARARQDSAEHLRILVEKPFHLSQKRAALPDFKLSHLYCMSDDTGILQHAKFDIPNRKEGYCIDDNARALIFTVLLESNQPISSELSILQSRYLSFVLSAFNSENGRFRNFMSFDRQWLEKKGSEDSQGRTLWSLAMILNRSKDKNRQELCKELFEKAVSKLFSTTSPRTWAYGILAADEYLQANPNDYSIQSLVDTLSRRLWKQFEAERSTEWNWFEQIVSYANGRLPQALLLAGNTLDNEEMIEGGLESLRWLMRVQTGPAGEFSPIGSNGFYVRGKERSFYDQQPIEAWTSLSACLTASRVSGDEYWLTLALSTFDWFLGKNSVGLSLYDKTTGGCRDGLGPSKLNHNQGAESTLSFLCSLAELKESLAQKAFAASVALVSPNPLRVNSLVNEIK